MKVKSRVASLHLHYVEKTLLIYPAICILVSYYVIRFRFMIRGVEVSTIETSGLFGSKLIVPSKNEPINHKQIDDGRLYGGC